MKDVYNGGLKFCYKPAKLLTRLIYLDRSAQIQ